jgi:hypothetical protein
MTDQTYDQLRAQIRAEYDRLLQAKRWLETTAPQMMDHFGPVKPYAQCLIQPILDALNRYVRLTADWYETFSEIEWDFVDIANHDSDIWKQVRQAALGVVQRVTRFSEDKERVTSQAQADAKAQAPHGPVTPSDPNAHSPWSGLAGTAYSAQIMPQATAAQFVADLAQDTSEFLRQSGENFGTLIAILTGLMQQVVLFWIMVAAALIELVVGIRGKSWPAVTWAIYTFALAMVQRLMLINPSIIAYQNAQQIFQNNTNRRMQDIDVRLSAVPDVFHYLAANSAHWPDPTLLAWYPHVVGDSSSGYRVTTGGK